MRNSYQVYVPPFNSNFHNKTLCESGVMWINRFVTYLSIAFHIYLLAYYYSFLAHYNKKCFNINWFHLLSPTILSLWYPRFEVTWLLRDNSNSKTRVRFVYGLPHILHGDFVYEIKYLVSPHLNLLLWNRWTKLKQIWLGWSLGGPLSIMCPTALLLKIEISLVVNFHFITNQNELEF